MAESIRQRLDRVLDHVGDLGARAKQIVLSHDDLDELKAQLDDQHAYRGIPIKDGEIGQSSYVEAEGAPSGDTNFGV